jgi:hypothetical protein
VGGGWYLPASCLPQAQDSLAGSVSRQLSLLIPWVSQGSTVLGLRFPKS